MQGRLKLRGTGLTLTPIGGIQGLLKLTSGTRATATPRNPQRGCSPYPASRDAPLEVGVSCGNGSATPCLLEELAHQTSVKGVISH